MDIRDIEELADKVKVTTEKSGTRERIISNSGTYFYAFTQGEDEQYIFVVNPIPIEMKRLFENDNVTDIVTIYMPDRTVHISEYNLSKIPSLADFSNILGVFGPKILSTVYVLLKYVSDDVLTDRRMSNLYKEQGPGGNNEDSRRT